MIMMVLECSATRVLATSSCTRVLVFILAPCFGIAHVGGG